MPSPIKVTQTPFPRSAADAVSSASNDIWSVAIFSARESVATLAGALRAALRASTGKRVIIDVLVNGNMALAEQINRVADGLTDVEPTASVRVWFIPLGDKAHTWNEFVHRLWPQAHTTFFIDGYVELRPDALTLIAEALRNAPALLGATGVPSSGRSAEKLKAHMLKHGGIHGNLYAMSAEAMQLTRASGFRLPLGLYRTDPLLGAAMMYRFDPANCSWNDKLFLVHPTATWTVHGQPFWSRDNLLAQFKRRLRQAQGDLENQAARQHLTIERLPPQKMARTVQQFVNNWMAAQPAQLHRLYLRRPLTYFAAKKLRQPRDWSAAELPTEMLANRHTPQESSTLAKF